MLGRRIKRILRDRRGSTAPELLGSVFIITINFVTFLVMLMYIMQYFQMTTAVRKMTREVEISGDPSSVTSGALNSWLGTNDAHLTVNSVRVLDEGGAEYVPSTHKLKDRFVVSVKAGYTIPLITTGGKMRGPTLPMNVDMKGMVEYYAK